MQQKGNGVMDKYRIYSNWYLTIIFINERKENEVFSTIDIKNSCNSTTSSISSYVNFLRKYGYIERIKTGKYIKSKEIPDTLTIQKLKDVIYHSAFERIRKIENIKKRMSEIK